MLTDRGPALHGGGSDALRRRNLAAILGLVHRSGGCSRSSLTRSTGLNRSTVAGLVAELVERGLVVEQEPDAASGVGRPSPVVRPGEGIAVVAIVPEVEFVTVGLVALGGRVLDRRRAPVADPADAAAVTALVGGLVAAVRAENPTIRVLGAAAAVPGLVRASDGVVLLAPHLGWRDEAFGSRLAAELALPVAVSNDATLGAAAEAVFGSARGYSDAVYLNGGSSGIGGGIIAGGSPLRGTAGFAGEFGHTHVAADEKRDPAGVAGSLEAEVRRGELLRLLGLGPVDEEGLRTALLASEDATVLAEVERQLGFLATVLGTVVNILNPEIIVLGGFLATLDEALPGRLEELLADRALAAALDCVRVTRAELGPDLLLIGAGELGFAPLLEDPARTG